MATDASTPFQSVLSSLIEKFLQEKHACGYSYREPIRILRHLDSFLVQEGLTTCELSASIARKWLAKKAHEGARTQAQRITVTRQFSRFLLRLGYSAYLPDCTLVSKSSTFVPRMLSDEELQKFFLAVDTLQPTARSPLRHLIMPEVFRLLYGCGFRVTEVLKLRVRDVDLDQDIITVHQGKFRKDRLVPPALPVVNRFESMPPSLTIAHPMPSSFRDPVEAHSSYARFTQSFVNCFYIVDPSRRTRQGARIHDYRHLFAIHTLRRWYRGGEVLDAELPLFATYLGHQNLSGTQRYLHLTAELFPEITARADAAFGDVIPGGEP